MNRFIIVLLALNAHFSCTEKSGSGLGKTAGFRLEIIDSLQIDYLGNVWFLDYESESQSYLAWGNRDKEVLVLDENGLIKSTFDFPSDGPDALIGWINPIGL
ncbi:hypothetical protein [Algoriphagus antarcticus]|uniref:Uncharacterized protein n=1 Tax=Algoriphagus antarcticus TaxID=238540 RepID=A0A3E0DG75_9BACT|nr:hypothetical protein [Algoriphagus antarcticus]REG81728.1 hypothetical protein C8N25_12573 [Algoriphagus antarcticus]